MNSENLTSRQKQAIETRKTIFDTTVNLINKYDFDKITIRMICKEANVSVGTFYQYFKSKQDIILELYGNIDGILLDVNITSRNDLNSIEKITEIVKIIIDYTITIDIKITKMIYTSYMYSNDGFFLLENRPIFTIIKLVIIEGQKNNEIIDNMTSGEIAIILMRFFRGIIFDWLIHNGEYQLRETALKEISLYLNLFKCK